MPHPSGFPPHALLASFRAPLGLLITLPLAAASLAAPNEPPPQNLTHALTALRQVGLEGHGHPDAIVAWQSLAQQDPQALPSLLAAMDGAHPLAKNWLRTAIETIAARTRTPHAPLPLEPLETFLRQEQHEPLARWLAYDLIAQADPARAEALAPRFLNDPAGPLRRLALQRLIAEAASLRSQDPAAAQTRYQTALHAARDVDQIETIAAALRELGHPVNLLETFGWVTHWHLIGPFDNTRRTGFDQVFPPETELRLDARYDGKSGPVPWRPWVVTRDDGKVDLNPALGAAKEVTGYALATFVADRPQAAEIRLGCKNAWKIWLDGRFLFGRDEYHRGMEMDQYRLPVTLNPGPHTLLVKICQNEQVEDWTVEWEFQLRLTDPLGTPLRWQNPPPATPAAP